MRKISFFSIFFLRARLKNIKLGFYSIKHGELSKMGHALKKKHLFRFALNTALTPTSEVLLNNLTGNHSSVDG